MLSTVSRRVASCLYVGPAFLEGFGGLSMQVMGKKYTPSGNISPKRGNKNFYKGTGAKKYGKPDQHGKFQLRPEGKPTWLIPDLTEFKLKPYVQWLQVEQRPKLTLPPIYPHPGGGPFVPAGEAEAAPTAASSTPADA